MFFVGFLAGVAMTVGGYAFLRSDLGAELWAKVKDRLSKP
jgi:hypothetical protein